MNSPVGCNNQLQHLGLRKDKIAQGSITKCPGSQWISHKEQVKSCKCHIWGGKEIVWDGEHVIRKNITEWKIPNLNLEETVQDLKILVWDKVLRAKCKTQWGGQKDILLYSTLFTNSFGEGAFILKINYPLLHNTGSVKGRKKIEIHWFLKEKRKWVINDC